MQSLDGIRGFACLLVVAQHLYYAIGDELAPIPFSFGAIGVMIFFTLSSFLMTTLYISRPFKCDDIQKYAIARFSRIAPAYWIAVILAALIFLAFPAFYYHMDFKMFLRCLAFMGSAGVFWSIPPEVQFYGFFILVWLAYNQSQKGRHVLSTAVLVIVILAFATKEHWPGIALPSKLHIFVSGIVGALLVRNEYIAAKLCHEVTQALIYLALVVYLFAWPHDRTLYDDLFFVVLIGLFVASASKSTKCTKFFATEQMRLIGAASFSIYLFHEMLIMTLAKPDFIGDLPLFAKVGLLAIVGLSIPVAFHFAVEKRLTALTRATVTQLTFRKRLVG